MNQFNDLDLASNFSFTTHFTLLWYGAVEKAGQWVSKDDVELKECFDKEYEEK